MTVAFSLLHTGDLEQEQPEHMLCYEVEYLLNGNHVDLILMPASN